MAEIIFSADSTVDLTKELITKHGINIAPLSVIIGGTEYLDGVTLQADEIYDMVEKTGVLPRTAAINQTAFLEHFNVIRKNDLSKTVIHFSISSELSCSFQNAVNASKETENVLIVDGRSLSTGTSLLMLKAIDMAKKGASVSEIYDYCLSATGKIQASFVVDDLLYLYKGGRCKGLTMYMANLLKIHPMLTLNDGFLKPDVKFRGSMKVAITKYIEHLKETHPNVDTTRAFVTHTMMDPAIVEHAIALTKKYFDFSEIIETTAGATITSHCGKGTLGLLFMDK